MSCKGLHCGGCRGGGGIGLAVIVAVVLVIAAAGKVIREAVHVVSVMLEVAVLALIAVAVVALVVVGVRLGRQVRERQYQERLAAAAVPRVTYQAVPVDDDLLEIEPSRLRLTGVEDLAPATLPLRRDSRQST